jgi:hypothetical protein
LNKFSFFFFIVLFFSITSKAQQSDSLLHNADSSKLAKDSISVVTASDSLFSDSIRFKTSNIEKNKTNQYKKILEQNRFVTNTKIPAVAYQLDRLFENRNSYFYAISVLFFFLGILKIAFGKYFSNMVRVFFNTSLRQTQLKDQLLQDRMPSLFFNLLFVVVGGIYIYLLLLANGKVVYNDYKYLYYGMLALTIVYTSKFLVLHLIGWLSGFTRDTDNYIFIVFLINKILAILLMPFIVVIAFADKSVSEISILISLIMVGFMFILRYLRGFSIIQQTLKISKFHFLLYIITVELLPIFLIYQLVWNILSKSL